MTRTLRHLASVALLATIALGACGDDEGGAPADAGTDGAVEACHSANPCGEGLVCVDELCVPGGDVDVVISSAVRGCEVLFEDTGDAKTGDVRFGEGVKGSYVRRAPRLALSFVAAGDEAVAAADVVPVALGTGKPELVEASCFDKAGDELPESAFVLGGAP